MVKFVLKSVVRGYHVYQTIWEAAIGEELPCKAESGNCSDRFAVVVISSDIFTRYSTKHVLDT